MQIAKGVSVRVCVCTFRIILHCFCIITLTAPLSERLSQLSLHKKVKVVLNSQPLCTLKISTFANLKEHMVVNFKFRIMRCV